MRSLGAHKWPVCGDGLRSNARKLKRIERSYEGPHGERLKIDRLGSCESRQRRATKIAGGGSDEDRHRRARFATGGESDEDCPVSSFGMCFFNEIAGSAPGKRSRACRRAEREVGSGRISWCLTMRLLCRFRPHDPGGGQGQSRNSRGEKLAPWIKCC